MKIQAKELAESLLRLEASDLSCIFINTSDVHLYLLGDQLLIEANLSNQRAKICEIKQVENPAQDFWGFELSMEDLTDLQIALFQYPDMATIEVLLSDNEIVMVAHIPDICIKTYQDNGGAIMNDLDSIVNALDTEDTKECSLYLLDKKSIEECFNNVLYNLDKDSLLPMLERSFVIDQDEWLRLASFMVEDTHSNLNLDYALGERDHFRYLTVTFSEEGYYAHWALPAAIIQQDGEARCYDQWSFTTISLPISVISLVKEIIEMTPDVDVVISLEDHTASVILISGDSRFVIECYQNVVPEWTRPSWARYPTSGVVIDFKTVTILIKDMLTEMQPFSYFDQRQDQKNLPMKKIVGISVSSDNLLVIRDYQNRISPKTMPVTGYTGMEEVYFDLEDFFLYIQRFGYIKDKEFMMCLPDDGSLPLVWMNSLSGGYQRTTICLLGLVPGSKKETVTPELGMFRSPWINIDIMRDSVFTTSENYDDYSKMDQSESLLASEHLGRLYLIAQILDKQGLSAQQIPGYLFVKDILFTNEGQELCSLFPFN